MGNSRHGRGARRKKGGAALFAAAFALMVVGAATTTTGCRARFGNMLSRSDEIDIGRQVKRNVERQNRLVNDPEINARMQRIADRIFPLARRDFDVPYEVRIIDKKEVNAFALPGGPIYFYKGLIDLAESDDEIAAVLSHEVTHVSKRHTGRQISDAQGKSTIAQLLLGRAGNVANIFANIAFSLDQLKYSRDDEAQSDEIGFRYLTQAGYNPEAMASFFRKMQKKSGGGGPEWLASHPLTRKRIEAAEKRARDYNAAQGTTGTPPAGTPPALPQPPSAPVPGGAAR